MEKSKEIKIKLGYKLIDDREVEVTVGVEYDGDKDDKKDLEVEIEHGIVSVKHESLGLELQLELSKLQGIDDDEEMEERIHEVEE